MDAVDVGTIKPGMVKVEAVNPHDLSEANFSAIHEVSQDMWASKSGLGELVRCSCCGSMWSKEDVFGHLAEEVQSMTVARIMRSMGIEKIDCLQCGGETRFIYGPENVAKIKERVLGSVDSFLVLCTDARGEIVGFEEGYVDGIDRIFDLDLELHYRRIGVQVIKDRVERALWYDPKHLLFLSSIGLIGPYQNFPNFLELLNQFARAIPDEYLDMPGITELNKKGVTYKITQTASAGISLGIGEDPELRGKFDDIGENYESDLVVYRSLARGYKEVFTQWVRHFLSLWRREKNIGRPKHRAMGIGSYVGKREIDLVQKGENI